MLPEGDYNVGYRRNDGTLENAPVRFPARLTSGTRRVGTPEMLMVGSFGSRFFVGRALWLTLNDLWVDQNHFKRLHRDLGKHQKDPNRRVKLGDNLPELPARMEWVDKYPRLIIRPITGRELMTTMIWLGLTDVLKFQACQNPKCRKEFIWDEQRMYCPDRECAHAVAQRNYRQRFTDQGLTTRGTKRKRGPPKSP